MNQLNIKNDYWKELAKKGDNEERLKLTLENLFHSYNKIFIEKMQTEKYHHNIGEILEEINKKLDIIFEKFNFLKIREKKERKKAFITQIKKNIELIINKSAFCSITFPSYQLYQFFLAFSSLINEIEFKINKHQIKATAIVPTKNLFIELTLKNSKSYIFFKKGKIKLDINELAKILKSNNIDKSTTEIIFGESYLYIEIKSHHYNSLIKRRINERNFELDNVSMDNFKDIDYTCQFSISKERFVYLLRNLDIFSDNIYIKVMNNKVSFSETCSNGKGEIIWKEGTIENIKIKSDPIQNEYIKPKNKKPDVNIDLNNVEYTTSHSLIYLKAIGKMCNILNNSDILTFKIKHPYSTMIEMVFNKLSDTNINYYIAPSSDNIRNSN